MLVVAVSGKQRAGKDTLVEKLGRHIKKIDSEIPFVKVPLAAGVYQIAQDYFNMVDKDRELLIKIGMGMRSIDPKVWINRTWKTIHKLAVNDMSTIVFIPDVRFANEQRVLKNLCEEYHLDYLAVNVEAIQEHRAKRPGYTPEHENDSSESQEDLVFDMTVRNNTDNPSEFTQDILWSDLFKFLQLYVDLSAHPDYWEPEYFLETTLDFSLDPHILDQVSKTHMAQHVIEELGLEEFHVSPTLLYGHTPDEGV